MIWQHYISNSYFVCRELSNATNILSLESLIGLGPTDELIYKALNELLDREFRSLNAKLFIVGSRNGLSRTCRDLFGKYSSAKNSDYDLVLCLNTHSYSSHQMIELALKIDEYLDLYFNGKVCDYINTSFARINLFPASFDEHIEYLIKILNTDPGKQISQNLQVGDIVALARVILEYPEYISNINKIFKRAAPSIDVKTFLVEIVFKSISLYKNRETHNPANLDSEELLVLWINIRDQLNDLLLKYTIPTFIDANLEP